MTTAFEQAPDTATYRANTAVLRFVLRILGWSGAEFGRRLKIHESTASRILRGTAPLTAGNARRLLDLVPGLRIEEVVDLPGLSPGLPAGAVEPGVPTLRVECTDDGAAQRFANHLRSVEEVDIDGIDGATVLVPWGGASASFVIDIFGMAVDRGWAADEVAAREMAKTLATMPGAK